MTPLDPSDFPTLRRVFAGYLHEDFGVEHGSPAAALRAFAADASPAERRRFAREARRLLDRTAKLDDDDLSTLVGRLGSRWSPPSREALTVLLLEAIEPQP
jgi:contact-dependent growth inhibition (CDI) system CdiI-like immunity protein